MPERLLKLHPIGLTFCGIHLSQTWADLYIWEKVLNETKPARVVELGTYDGGFSVFLKVQARVRGMQFFTFDIVNHIKTGYFDTDFWQVDIHDYEPGKQQVIELCKAEGKTILFCDNGNKEAEAITFAPHLKPNDVLAVHDWGTECTQVPEFLELYHPESDTHMYDSLKSMTRFFLKPEEDE